MAEINCLIHETRLKNTGKYMDDDQIRQVIAYIDQNFQQRLSLCHLANTFFVSKYHLSHEFKRVAGVSVYRYIILRRLSVAKNNLKAGKTPMNACRICGFRDYANFYRAFKREYGLNPGQYAELWKVDK